MNDVGKLIEERRRILGMSRQQLASRLGKTSQTILNIEHDPNYNIGTSLLKRLEEVLSVEFTVEIQEARNMNDYIQMGNDEFILYIRKIFPQCKQSNAQLGKSIWIWIRDNADGTKTEEDQPCMWGAAAENISDIGLPVTATQFKFRLESLPDLYRFLFSLGES